MFEVKKLTGERLMFKAKQSDRARERDGSAVPAFSSVQHFWSLTRKIKS